MKARQYKKLCKQARALLIALGEPASDFSKEDDSITVKGRHVWVYVWGINTGPDYFGECDWYDAWHVLSQRIADETATWGPYEQFPYRSSIKKTIAVLRYAQQQVEIKKNVL
ncbi:hypothetical protein [Microbulbifer sp. PSTR4-B]|uniref:hypothetical protein n=1 Tax=unclassified Microbulbifer TaxID=2619833 RepID=UPI00403AEA03